MKKIEDAAVGKRPAGPDARRVEMPLWKRFWILFTVIWVLVALLNAITLIVFEEEVPQGRLEMLLLAAILVPAVLYAAGWLRDRIRRERD